MTAYKTSQDSQLVAPPGRDRVVRRAFRAKTITVLTHLRIESRTHHLMQCLLAQSVLNPRDAKPTAAAVCLWYLDCPDRSWFVLSV